MLFQYAQHKMRHIQSDVESSQYSVDPVAERLHGEAMELKQKHARAKELKDKDEIEEAYLLSNMPLAKKIPDRMYNNASQRSLQIRSMEQFMEDQIKFEQRRYENLKNAILMEEA